MEKVKHIVNFSGGKDSTAMLFKMLENGYKIDYIVFCNTGVEFPEMYKHIEQVKKELIKFNLKIIELKPNHSFFYWLTDYKRTRGEYKGLPYGFPSWKNRWCTTNIKLRPLFKFEQQLIKKGFTIISYVGYSLDETKRATKIKKRETKNKKFKFPLIEDFKMTEKDCLKYSYNLGFDWDGVYDKVSRLSCYICPFSRLSEIKFLMTEHPDLWEKIKQTEADLKKRGIPYWKFTSRYSCEEIEQLIAKQK